MANESEACLIKLSGHKWTEVIMSSYIIPLSVTSLSLLNQYTESRPISHYNADYQFFPN